MTADTPSFENQFQDHADDTPDQDVETQNAEAPTETPAAPSTETSNGTSPVRGGAEGGGREGGGQEDDGQGSEDAQKQTDSAAAKELNRILAETFSRQTTSADMAAVIVETFAVAMEAHGEALGWDAGGCLVEMMMDPLEEHQVNLLAQMADTHASTKRRVKGSADLSDLIGPDGMFGYAISGRLVPMEGEHPLDTLTGRYADPEAIGVALATEAWAYGPEAQQQSSNGEEVGFSPSEDPDRVELRHVIALLRDGTMAVAVRVRGEEPQVTVHAGGDGSPLSWEGRLLDGLRRYVGLSTGKPVRSLRDTAAAAYLMMSAEAAVSGQNKPQSGWAVGERLSGVLGVERALMLMISQETASWGQARDLAVSIVRRAAALKEELQEGLQEEKEGTDSGQMNTLKEWLDSRAQELEWLDEAMLSREYSDIPGLGVAARIVHKLAEEGAIERDQARHLLSRARKVKDQGWPVGEGFAGV